MAVVALMLLLGSWLVVLSESLGTEYAFGDAWVWTGAVVLLVAAVGFALAGAHAERLIKALAEAPDGPATPELKALAGEPLTFVLGHSVLFMIIGVASNMVSKPGTAVSLLVLVVVGVIGALLGSRQSRTGTQITR